jgi:hypothetical protein
MDEPGYWMNETSGRLEGAIWALLEGAPLTGEQIPLIRAYLRQWIAAPAWQGPMIEGLRASVDGLVSREAINAWLAVALEQGIDPL